MSCLAVTDLSKSYDDVKALAGFSLDVNRGEMYALVGPDGAGKTTLIRCLCHLVTPDAGRMTIGGHDVSQEFEKIKPILGYMPQHFSLYPDLSVEENLKFYGGINGLNRHRFREKCDQLYAFSNLAPFADRRASALSGGMKQKLALSCALIHAPEVLILDEPTTGVDPLSRRQFWEILLQLKREGVTVLVSTPYMDEAARVDRACFIFDGKKLTEGEPDQLVARFDGRIYRYEVEPADSLIKGINAIEGLISRRFGTGLHLYTSAGVSIESFRTPLAQFNIDTEKLIPVPADLEDRFIQLMEKQT